MIEQLLKQFKKSEENLIPVLNAVQEHKSEKYISYDEMKIIAEYFNLPLSKVKGVITFYSFLSLKPRGKYVIRVCESIPCYVNGAFNVIESFKKELGINIGETTYDGMFTLETTSCMGCCATGPSCMVNDDVYELLDHEKIKKLIQKYYEEK